MNTSKGTERINDEGAVEINVETVDYRTPPGGDKEPHKENVEITHLTRTDESPDTGNKVVDNLRSAKEPISHSAKADKKAD
ncbi:hypothetical protein DH2020_027234 [Rehmannia glutinosa]|uniref:Hypervirulence associated protein TUDOR domain-containing protein n=1 Tax=Rehmannia glutinosa TaxID=99300 RepID=A0ABR0VWK6_REHGL